MSHHYKYKYDVFNFLAITTHVTGVPHIYIKFKIFFLNKISNTIIAIYVSEIIPTLFT